MMIFDTSLYKYAQYHLKILGYHPLINVTSYQLPFKLIIPIPVIIVLLLAIIEIIQNSNNIFIILECVETIFSTAQVNML